MEGRLPRVWRQQFFGILGVFARFLRKARTNTLMQFRPESYLSKEQFGIINDTAYELNHYDERKTYFEESLSRDKLVLIRQEKQFGMLYKQLRKTYRSKHTNMKLETHRFKGMIHIGFILLLSTSSSLFLQSKYRPKLIKSQKLFLFLSMFANLMFLHSLQSQTIGCIAKDRSS